MKISALLTFIALLVGYHTPLASSHRYLHGSMASPSVNISGSSTSSQDTGAAPIVRSWFSSLHNASFASAQFSCDNRSAINAPLLARDTTFSSQQSEVRSSDMEQAALRNPEKFIRLSPMHPQTSSSTSSTPQGSTSAMSSTSSSSDVSIEKNTTPARRRILLLVPFNGRGKTFSNLRDGSGEKYGLDASILGQTEKRTFTQATTSSPSSQNNFTELREPVRKIKKILIQDIVGSALSDWFISTAQNDNGLRITYDQRARTTDFLSRYHFVNLENLEKAVRPYQLLPAENCYTLQLSLNEHGAPYGRIVAGYKGGIIKIFQGNPMRLLYTFKRAPTSTYIESPIITTSKDFIVIGAKNQLEFYQEDKNGCSAHYYISCKLKYKDAATNQLCKPQITALTISHENNDTIVGLLSINSCPFFFALSITALQQSKKNPSLEIFRLPDEYHNKLGHTIIDRFDGTFLVALEDNRQLRFRSPYYQDIASRLMPSVATLFAIYETAYQKIKPPENYLIFRQTPYLSTDADPVAVPPKIAAVCPSLPKQLVQLIYEYARDIRKFSIYECFHFNKQADLQEIPLIVLPRHKIALAWNGKILLFDADKLPFPIKKKPEFTLPTSSPA